jgi:hypothetical protein
VTVADQTADHPPAGPERAPAGPEQSRVKLRHAALAYDDSVPMCQVRMIGREHQLIFIPVESAVYCETCRNISNSITERCGRCGSEAIRNLARMINQPPGGPDSGPGSSGCVVPIHRLEVARAA